MRLPNTSRDLTRAVLPILVFAGTSSAQRVPEAELVVPSRNVPPRWLTWAEKTSFRQTPRYDQTISYCRDMAAESEWIQYRSFGTSPEGRELPLLIASTNPDLTPENVHTDGKLVVLVQNGIHAGECAGKDASLMLLRDIAVTRERAELLEYVNLLVIPIYNVDGHERFGPYSRINQNGPEEMGWRTTSRNLNLGRDYTKADAAETQAWLRLWNDWQPDFFIDTHTTDGGDWQYDLLYAMETHAAVSPALKRWIEFRYEAEVFAALLADGHLTIPYFWFLDSKDPAKGIQSGGFGPRFGTGYAAVRNRPSLLVEAHMLKSYRTRVIATYNIILHTLELLNREPGVLRESIREAISESMVVGKAYDPSARFPLALEHTGESEPIRFQGVAYRQELSPVSGATRIVYDGSKPLEIETVWHRDLAVAASVDPPIGYLVPPQWTEVIERIRLHGLLHFELTSPAVVPVQKMRLEEVEFPSHPYEGRFRPKFRVHRSYEERPFPEGTVYVPVDQPEARLVLHLLEPDAPDSLVRWGFFNSIFEQKEYAEAYILEKLARQMLEENPALAEEFQEKVRSDKEFAADPRARLNFFYQRSPYWDDRIGVYPVARVLDASAAKKLPLKRIEPGR